MFLYGKPDWDMKLENPNHEEIRETGKAINDRLDKVAKNVEILKGTEFEVYGTLYEINISTPDDMTEEDIISRFKKLNLNMDVIHIHEM